MKKTKKQPRELTQYQLDRQVYNAFADRAYWRACMAKVGVSLPWEDPTASYSPDEE